MNPHGMGQRGHVSTASDIIVLMNYALKYDIIRQTMSKQIYRCNVYSFDLKTLKFWWPNTNKLKNDFF